MKSAGIAAHLVGEVAKALRPELLRQQQLVEDQHLRLDGEGEIVLGLGPIRQFAEALRRELEQVVLARHLGPAVDRAGEEQVGATRAGRGLRPLALERLVVAADAQGFHLDPGIAFVERLDDRLPIVGTQRRIAEHATFLPGRRFQLSPVLGARARRRRESHQQCRHARGETTGDRHGMLPSARRSICCRSGGRGSRYAFSFHPHGTTPRAHRRGWALGRDLIARCPPPAIYLVKRFIEAESLSMAQEKRGEIEAVPRNYGSAAHPATARALRIFGGTARVPMTPRSASLAISASGNPRIPCRTSWLC